MKVCYYLLLSLFVLVSISACGRMGPPLPPEAFAPAPVRYFEVIPTQSAVVIRWQSPEQDRRGEELVDLSGHRIYRRQVEVGESLFGDRGDDLSSPELTEALDEELLAVVPDRSIEEMLERRELAVAAKTPSRRVKADPTLQRHEYSDNTVERGESYLYWIEPFSEVSESGRVIQYARVEFLGEASRIEFIGTSSLMKKDDLLGESSEEAFLQ